MSICWSCGKPLIVQPVVRQLDGNSINLHKDCAERFDKYPPFRQESVSRPGRAFSSDTDPSVDSPDYKPEKPLDFGG